MDFGETQSQYHITADVPGMKREDMEVTVQDQRVCIRGNRPAFEFAQGTPSGYFLRERGLGQFERCIGLPSRVNEGSVAASYNDGVLQISMDKAEAGKSGTISIR